MTRRAKKPEVAIAEMVRDALEAAKPLQDMEAGARILGPGDVLSFSGGETLHPDCSACDHRAVVREITYEEWLPLREAYLARLRSMPKRTVIAEEGDVVPVGFEMTADDCLSNFDHAEVPGAADCLRAKRISMKYSGYNFNGDVWFDRDRSLFVCAVHRYHAHVATYTAPTLAELIPLVSNDYGWE